jgi:two-component system NarL family sensor kinase
LKAVDQSNEFIVAILAGTILFLLFAGFIIAYILIYRKKRSRHFQEMDKMKTIFNEEILKSRLEIQEHTFNHISQEIHDNVGQILSLANIQLNIMDQKEELDKTLLADAKENISKAMSDLRDIAKGLSREMIQHLNLQETIAEELQRINKTGLMRAETQMEGEEQPVDDQTKLIIFRIIQECLQNIIKHSSASKIKVAFHYQGDQIKIMVADDGKGFDPAEGSYKQKGLGLQNIIHRAALLGGSASVDSAPGAGTKISIVVPYV